LAELDADPWLLGVQNGVLDLRTGQLHAPSPKQMVTKRCNVAYDPNASTEFFQTFVERIQQEKPGMVKFLQRIAGYVLTGDVSAHCFFFFFGYGRNGKTTLAELLYWMLGTYATVIPKETLMLSKRDPGAAAPDLMLLKGCRFALTAELEEGSRFDESRIKMLTGGDTMTARNPYGLFVTWTPTAKLVIVGNHKPIISGNDRGIWSRVRLVPFVEKFVGDECDPDLPNKLKLFGSGFLNWALEGLADYKVGGLRPPQEVVSAGSQYQSDMDIIGQWMDEHITEDATQSTRTQTLFNAYRAWARDSGWHRSMTRQSFGRRLTERGVLIEKGRDGNKIARGVILNKEGLLAAVTGATYG
jgi:putative DNA primase/helicase